jgi:hypothetical protein
VAAILKNPDITENKIMHFAGDVQTANSLLAMYEKQLGKKFDVTYRSAEEIDWVAEEERKNGNEAVYLKSRVPYFLATGVSTPLPTLAYRCSGLRSINRRKGGTISWTMKSFRKSRQRWPSKLLASFRSRIEAR